MAHLPHFGYNKIFPQKSHTFKCLPLDTISEKSNVQV